MPIEDFTDPSWVEVDPYSSIEFDANTVSVTAFHPRDASDSRFYNDKGVNHFSGNFEHLLDLKITGDAGYNADQWAFWMLSNDIEDIAWLISNNKRALYVTARRTATPYVLRIGEIYDGAEYTADLTGLTEGTPYYLIIYRTGSTFGLHVYTDAERTNEVSGSPITLTLHSIESLRYLWVTNNRDNTVTSNRMSGYVENLDLQEGIIVKEVADTLSLSDAVVCNKNLVVTDGVGLVDTPLRNWSPQITDSISIAEAVLRDKTLLLADSVNLSDVSLIHKTLTVTDSISLSELVTVITGAIIKEVADSIGLSDAVLVNKTLLIVTDALSLSDVILINKILQVADTIGLSEVVTKIVPTAAKTKIFLMIGNIAIQLCGD